MSDGGEELDPVADGGPRTKRDLRAIFADGVLFSLMVGWGETYVPAFALAIGMGEIAAGWIMSIPMVLGAVLQLIRRRHEVWADVQGSFYAPYLVRVSFEGENVKEARCDCPHEGGGWCKHIVAALMAMVCQPERIEERATLMELLIGLDRIQLTAMLWELGERYPHIMREIEEWVMANDLPTPPRQ